MKVLLTLSFLLCSLLSSAAPLKNIVVFGDSLSDNGNLYEYMQHKLPLSPPYYKGRFSNGPVWIEHLANLCFPGQGEQRLLDYAFGGAGIADKGEYEALFTLEHEVDSYLLAHQDKADPSSLFVFWIGANNYLSPLVDVKKSVKLVTNSIKQEMRRLARAGAEHILVINLPDLGKVPMARNFGLEKELSYATKQHNKALHQAFIDVRIKYPLVQWHYFDAERSLSYLIKNPESFGFTNTKGTCFDAIVEKLGNYTVLDMASKIAKHAMTSQQCEGYLFFDPLHSTEPAHIIFAKIVLAQLEAEGLVFE